MCLPPLPGVRHRADPPSPQGGHGWRGRPHALAGRASVADSPLCPASSEPAHCARRGTRRIGARAGGRRTGGLPGANASGLGGMLENMRAARLPARRHLAFATCLFSATPKTA